MKLSIAAAIGLLALSVTDAAVRKANPLPKPVTIDWKAGGRINVNKNFQFRLHLNGQKDEEKILTNAAQRAFRLIKEEKWVPQAWETPMPKWPDFPEFAGEKRADDDSDSDDEDDGVRGELRNVDIRVKNMNAPLQHGHDESYRIEVTSNGRASIAAETIWGALHGLSTFQQLVITEDGKGPLFIEQPVSIVDKPNYTHRGVMYDTGRNFLPLRAIKKQIDALAFSKLNVFHWHITDSQSWPLEIDNVKYPDFTKGAYSAREVYSHDHVREVVDYGRKRGVRVIPEIDMPAHSNMGWVHVDPQTITCGDSWWSNDNWPEHTAVQPNPGHLDILYPGTYTILKDMVKKIGPLFPDNIFHVGFDELIPECYNFSNRTQTWFGENKTRTHSDLVQQWVDKLLPIFLGDAANPSDNPNRRLMMWEDSVLSERMAAHRIPKTVIMQSWNKGVDNIKLLAEKGYDIVVTSADFFYLDCGHGGYVTNDGRYNEQSKPPIPKKITDLLKEMNYKGPYSLTTENYGGPGASWCSPYKSWQRIYGYDFTRGLEGEELDRVIGGEAAMWSETTDETNLDNKVWPRAAALAELLWSGNTHTQNDPSIGGVVGKKRVTELSSRIFEFRERLVARGINASPLVPKFCIQNAHHCDFNRNQTVWDK